MQQKESQRRVPTSFLDEKNGWPEVAVTSCQKAITANLQMADDHYCDVVSQLKEENGQEAD